MPERTRRLGTLGLACSLAGCARPTAPVQAPPVTDTDGLARYVQSDRTSVAPGTRRGLSLTTWVVEDTGGAVGSLLGEASLDLPPGAVDPRAAARLHEAGFRAVVVPESAVARIRDGLVSTSGQRMQWLGEITGWTSLALGPEIRARRLAGAGAGAGAGGAIEARGTRPRLIGRSWVEPAVDASDGGVRQVVRVELLLQLVEPRGKLSFDEIDARLGGRLPSIDGDGIILDELALTVRLADGAALVLTGEHPDVAWSVATGDGDAPVAAPAGVESTPGRAPPGPGLPRLKTLGEHMLTAPASDRPTGAGRVVEPPRKVLIVLAGRADGAFELLGRDG